MLYNSSTYYNVLYMHMLQITYSHTYIPTNTYELDDQLEDASITIYGICTSTSNGLWS